MNRARRLPTIAVLAVLSAVPGCSWLGENRDPYSLSPRLERGRRLGEDKASTKPFALTNEGREIEDRLLDGDRQASLPP